MQTPQLNHEFAQLIALVCEACPEFRAYPSRRIVVSLAASKGAGRSGIWAHVIPLRQVGGAKARRGRRGGFSGIYVYESEELDREHPEALYLMTFLLPRFFRLSSRERLETVVHELYHLHPEFRGDLRRFPSPHRHHGPTPAAFRHKVRALTEEALKEFPTLLDHPLLASDGTPYARHLRRRYRHPRQVFRFEAKNPPLQRSPSPSLSPGSFQRVPNFLLFVFVVGMALMWVTRVRAESVLTLKSGALYEQPSVRYPKVREFPKGMRFEVLRTSPQKSWIEVKDADEKRGWVPRQWVSGESAPSRPMIEGLNDFSLDQGVPEATPEPVDPVEHFDRRLDRFFATRSDRLFEKPDPLSNRFGVVEPEDEIKILQWNRAQTWARVRLLLTGEEGWVPRAAFRREQVRRPAVGGPWTVSLPLAWASQDHGLGFGLGAFYDFSKGFAKSRPRDRWEVGVDLMKWRGRTLITSNSEGKTSAMSAAVLGRYLGVDSGGRLIGGLELGLQLNKMSFSQTGVQNKILAKELASAGNYKSVGLVLGVSGGVILDDHWLVLIGLRGHLASHTFILASLNVGYRF